MEKIFSKYETLKVKGIALLLLLFHHMFSSTEIPNASSLYISSYEYIYPFVKCARICVWIFAFLSAYGLSISYNKKQNVLDFTIKQWFSLMKTYWLSYSFLLILYWIVVKNPIFLYKYHPVKFILDFFALSDFFGTPMISPVMWYMGLAQIIIILIPLLNELCKKIGVLLLPLSYILLLYMPDGVGIISKYGGEYSYYFLSIIMGTVCANTDFLNKFLQNSKRTFIEGAGLVCASTVLLGIKYLLGSNNMLQLKALISAIVPVLVCMYVSKYCTGKIIQNILVFLGRYSGIIYMTHMFFIGNFPQIIYWSPSCILNYLSLIIISIIVAKVLSYLQKILHFNNFVERIEKYIINVTHRFLIVSP